MAESDFHYIVRETGGTYEARPTVTAQPNCIWLGQSDATQHVDFVQWDPATGEGDTWQEVPT